MTDFVEPGGKISVVLSQNASTGEREAVRIFVERVRNRSCTQVEIVDEDSRTPGPSFSILTGVLGESAAISGVLDAKSLEAVRDGEGYLLYTSASDNISVVCGADPTGVLYGLGKLLRLMDFEDGVKIPVIEESSSPVGKERGVYFATHFNNWYESAPVEEVERYVEDLALWGVNTIWTWFDMNWYPYGFWNNPDSRGMRMVSKIRRINDTAHRLGMKVGLTGIANEGFKDQPPPKLRTDMSVKRGGFYPDSHICPSKPGGLEMILDNRRKVLELVGPIDAFWYWPYDQGGCGCSDCADENGWGKTFLKIGPDVSGIVKVLNPDARFIVSTWLMNDNELELVYEQANRDDRWFDGLLMETRRAGEPEVPEDVSLSVFPEVSMFGCFFVSYGCNGANPAPVRFTEEAERIAKMGYGAVLYSEGIYEDINKFVWASLMWNPDRPAEDVISEYCSVYFGRPQAKAATDLVMGLEKTWGVQNLPGASIETCRSLLSTAESMKDAIPDADWCRWRWQVLRDRIEIDYRILEVDRREGLLKQVRHVFDEAAYSDDIDTLRGKTIQLREALADRESKLSTLFDAYWHYMERFHLDSCVLVFRPDQVTGSVDYSKLLIACDEALALPDDEMRASIIKGIHRWLWANGVGIEFFIL